MQRFDSGMQNRVYSALHSWASDVKAEAMRNAPVRTGYLRSSIYARIQEWVAEVGAEATYSAFVERHPVYVRASFSLSRHPRISPDVGIHNNRGH